MQEECKKSVRRVYECKMSARRVQEEWNRGTSQYIVDGAPTSSRQAPTSPDKPRQVPDKSFPLPRTTKCRRARSPPKAARPPSSGWCRPKPAPAPSLAWTHRRHAATVQHARLVRGRSKAGHRGRTTCCCCCWWCCCWWWWWWCWWCCWWWCSTQ